jgi:hypothetical protein
MIVFINGPFGIGKTTVAELLVERLPDSLLYDAERVGSLLLRLYPPGKRPSDFQDSRLWRRLTVLLPRLLLATRRGPLIMPMTIWRPAYFREVVGGLRASEPNLYHFTLTATPATLEARICQSGEAINWRLDHLLLCTAALAAPEFATHIATDGKTPIEVVEAIMVRLAK